MKTINNTVIAAVFFAGMATFSAQEKKMLTLVEAVQLGIQNSKSLKSLLHDGPPLLQMLKFQQAELIT